MFVDFAPLEKATCRLALGTYDKALERHRKEAEKLNIGTLAVSIAQQRVGHLAARFRQEHDEKRTVEFIPELRVVLNDALSCEKSELEKKLDWLAEHLVDRRDLEKQLGRVESLIARMNDQYALEMETPIRVTQEGIEDIRAAVERDQTGTTLPPSKRAKKEQPPLPS